MCVLHLLTKGQLQEQTYGKMKEMIQILPIGQWSEAGIGERIQQESHFLTTNGILSERRKLLHTLQKIITKSVNKHIFVLSQLRSLKKTKNKTKPPSGLLLPSSLLFLLLAPSAKQL